MRKNTSYRMPGKTCKVRHLSFENQVANAALTGFVPFALNTTCQVQINTLLRQAQTMHLTGHSGKCLS
ncbi:hypothetical protein A4H97_09830 [Niastella yeongjuensis]|uniref:Uncharacterized protein n=1 Tax=Niastella yeongjuensis TaxID=354355 RepID=A0A1V9EFC1_9BACT|nr:hypothetical protein A4H97_09830 [Niastella yeongjuensis]